MDQRTDIIIENQINADLPLLPPTDYPSSQVTLEGISGMVVLDARTGERVDSGSLDAEKQLDDGPTIPYSDHEIKKGESGGASDSSSSEERAVLCQNENKMADENEAQGISELPDPDQFMKHTLDLETINIDQKELHEISNSNREHYKP